MNLKRQIPLISVLAIVICLALFISYKNASRHINIEQFDVRKLSSENVVIPYLKKHHRLPYYYITKKEAREKGWHPEKGNLCDVLPGRVIGGDHYSNREGNLPYRKKHNWFEADINYDCNRRGTDRLIFSDDGLIFVTYDHYNTFKQK